MRFTVPTQIKFLDEDRDHYIGGIAYKNQIICGCCGGIINIDEYLEYSHPDVPSSEKIIPLDWIDISNEIKGDD